MRLIDADKLTKQMEGYISDRQRSMDDYLIGCGDGAYKYQFAVDHAPTIEERKTGKWIHNVFEGGYYCSVCGNGRWVHGVHPKQWKACPWCTALMEVEE